MERGKTTNRLGSLYSEALQKYLAGGGEEALRSAYEIGRTAFTKNLSLLDMAGLYHGALAETLIASPANEAHAKFSAAAEFFVESLSPYEMAHRGYRDAITALRFLNETLETEIKRIAHAVHDEAGQLLVAVHLDMAEIAKDMPLPLQERIKDVTGLLGQIEEQLRRLSHELHPMVLDDLGLVPAIRLLADRVSRRSSLSIWVEAKQDGRLSTAVETALYRIIQEAVNNAVKHARARSVRIQLDEDVWKTCCSIHDDGIGFDSSALLSGKGQKGLGLIGIQERLNAIGGILQINSEPGKGTSLLVTVPRQSSRSDERKQHPLSAFGGSGEDSGVSSSGACR